MVKVDGKRQNLVGASLRDRILFSVTVDGFTGCWNSNYCCNTHGYPHMAVNKKTIQVSRGSYSVFKGAIPKGLLVCHKCDNTRCVNPDHLFLGDSLANARDSVRKGRNKYPINKSDETHPTSKLTNAQVLIIRDSNLSSSELSMKYGITRGAIRKVITRRTYRGV